MNQVILYYHSDDYKQMAEWAEHFGWIMGPMGEFEDYPVTYRPLQPIQDSDE